MADPAWFAARLREMRESAGLTQEQLAEKAGVKRDAVARWEAGKREPGWSSVLSLCGALGVDCTAFAQEPAARGPAGPGRPPKKDADAPEQPKRPRGRPPNQQSAEQETPAKKEQKPKGGRPGSPR